MTASKEDVRAAMTDTIARFLEAAGDPARGWTTPRDGAERLAALLLRAIPMAGSPAAAPAIGALAATRSLRQLRQQEGRPLAVDAPLPSWAACADDHCRTVQHCVHEGAAARPAAPRDADRATATQATGTPATGKAELASAN